MTEMEKDVPGALYTTFKGLFSDDRCFKVPKYQRAYDWGEKQRRDLFDDLCRLDHLIETGRKANHFCGTVICTPPVKCEPYFAVVDGQQRLTTLALMHAQLGRTAKRPTFLKSEGTMLVVPQATDENTFEMLLSGKNPGKTDTIAQREYVRASNEIKDWIDGDKARARRMLDHIEQRLHFILFVLPDETEVAKVFESINNRGKPVSQMDLVKNHMIYVADVKDWKQPNVNEVWKGIQKIAASAQFAQDDVDMILRAVVTAQFRPGRRKAGDTDFSIVAEELRAQDAKYETFGTFLRFLKASFEAHEKMRESHSSDPKAPVKRALTFLNHHHSISGVLPLILAVQFQLPRKEKDGATDRKMARVLEAIEIANFRLYGLRGTSSRSDSHNVKLHTLAHDHFHGKKNYKKVIATLRKMVTKSQKDGFAAIIRSLSLDGDDKHDFYKWKWLRYFLGRFEEYLLDSQSFDFERLGHQMSDVSRTNDILTIEHIWPRKAEDPTVAEDNEGQQIRRLGNLMLLPHKVNIQRRNRDLESKAKQTAESDATLLRQNEEAEKDAELAKEFADHLSQRDNNQFGTVRNRFNQSTIKANWEIVKIRTLCDLREEKMIQFALQAWRFPDEDGKGHTFEGMFSLPHDGEAFLPTKEHTGTKYENYVMQSRGSKRSKVPSGLARLKARCKIIDRHIETVTWN